MSASRVWTVLAGALVLAVLAFGWILGVAPRLTEAALLDTQRLAAEAQSRAQQTSLDAVVEADARLDVVRAELDVLHERVPATPELEAFLRQIDGYAALSGATVSGYTTAEAVTYTGEVIQGSGSGTPDAGASVDGPSGPDGGTASQPRREIPDASSIGLHYVPVTIEVTGSFDQLKGFVRALQGGPRLFIGPSVTFSVEEGTGQSSAAISGYVFALPGAGRTTTTTVAP